MSLEALFAGSAVAKILDIYLKNHKENPQYSMKEIAELSHIHYGTTSKAVNTLENIQILVISGSIGRKRYYRLNSENSIVVPLINFYEGIITNLNTNREYEIAKAEIDMKFKKTFSK